MQLVNICRKRFHPLLYRQYFWENKENKVYNQSLIKMLSYFLKERNFLKLVNCMLAYKLLSAILNCHDVMNPHSHPSVVINCSKFDVRAFSGFGGVNSNRHNRVSQRGQKLIL